MPARPPVATLRFVAPSSEILLGIDLGTTFSTAAAVVDGKFQYALDARGESCIPSVVHFPKAGPPLVGAEADRFRANDPLNTVFGIKRVIGRSADSPPARLLHASAPFAVRQHSSGEACVHTRAGEVTASEVASIILRHLRDRAELRFGKRLTKTVLTVPVQASKEARDTMVRCGRMAGLDVVRVINEPVAGALARGIGGAGATREPMLVYDFGGGTLDAALVQRDGEAVKVLSAGGDDCLGGDDFDTAFAKWVATKVWGAHSVDITKDAILSDRIQRQCELVKRALSSKPEARFFVPDALGAAGRLRSIELTVAREQLRAPWGELVQRSIDATMQTLSAAALGPSELGQVLLIGGTTQIPQVRAAVAQAFPRPLAIENDPQTAVARGAAMLAVFPKLLTD
jgi:molecular chaperone DnaK